LFDVTGEHGPRRGLFQTREPDGERPGGGVVAQEADRRVGAAQAGLCGDVDDETQIATWRNQVECRDRALMAMGHAHRDLILPLSCLPARLLLRPKCRWWWS
jgi:hypothetical protein